MADGRKNMGYTEKSEQAKKVSDVKKKSKLLDNVLTKILKTNK